MPLNQKSVVDALPLNPGFKKFKPYLSLDHIPLYDTSTGKSLEAVSKGFKHLHSYLLFKKRGTFAMSIIDNVILKTLQILRNI
jgi:hypothetical protein